MGGSIRSASSYNGGGAGAAGFDPAPGGGGGSYVAAGGATIAAQNGARQGDGVAFFCYASQTLFSDGFDSGDTVQWSSNASATN